MPRTLRCLLAVLLAASVPTAGHASGVATALTAAWPHVVGNTSPATVIFDRDPAVAVEAVALRDPADVDHPGSNLTSLGGGRYLMATFDLSGAPVGSYAAVPTVDGLQSDPLYDAVSVVPGTVAGLWATIVGRRAVRVGTESAYTLWFGHGGTARLAAAVLFLKIPKGTEYALGFDPADYRPPGRGGLPPWPAIFDAPDATIVPIFVRDVLPVPVEPLPFTLRFGPTPGAHDVTVWWGAAEEAQP